MTLWSECVHSTLTLVFHSVRSVLFDLRRNRLTTFFELNYQYGNSKLSPMNMARRSIRIFPKWERSTMENGVQIFWLTPA